MVNSFSATFATISASPVSVSVYQPCDYSSKNTYSMTFRHLLHFVRWIHLAASICTDFRGL